MGFVVSGPSPGPLSGSRCKMSGLRYCAFSIATDAGTFGVSKSTNMNRSQKVTVFSALLLLLLLPLTLKLSACSPAPDTAGNTGKGFAVLELFTSEGCSSCPPAEQLLETLQQESAGHPVYILAYHVDYWDRLGWKDPFSDAAFSRRQYDYSRYFTGQVYTPQMIFNGQTEGVGSNESLIRQTLRKLQDQSNTEALNIKVRRQSGTAYIDYEATTAASRQLEIAFVEKYGVSKVTRGENGGRTLSHVQLVRSLQTFTIGKNKTGTQKAILPPGFNTTDWEIVGLLRNPNTGAITAAGRATLIL